MPELPVVSGAETVRALERLGFVETRQRGSHIVLRKGASGQGSCWASCHPGAKSYRANYDYAP